MIYLDHNATTPVVPEAREAVAHALESAWGNPSSSHKAGRTARRLVDAAREIVAELAGAEPEQVVFTSGATEALNTVIHAAGQGRVLASAVEHPAVWAALDLRDDRAAEALPVHGSGHVEVGEVLGAVDGGAKPALVSVMAANNETGVCLPVGALAGPLRERGVRMLVDAVQLAGKLPIDVEPDYLVVTAHKLGGPKGVGAVIVRHGAPLPPLIAGGGQERGHRGGTEPVPAIAGFAAAVRRCIDRGPEEEARLEALRDRLELRLLEAMPGARVVGASARRLPNTSSFMLPEGAEGEAVMNRLAVEGVAVSAGSACHTGSPKPSRVLTAMGLAPDECFRVLRLSLGWTTTPAHVDSVAELLPQIVRALR